MLPFLNLKSDDFPTDADSDDEGLEDLSDMSGDDDDDDAASDGEEDSGQCFHAVYDAVQSLPSIFSVDVTFARGGCRNPDATV